MKSSWLQRLPASKRQASLQNGALSAASDGYLYPGDTVAVVLMLPGDVRAALLRGEDSVCRYGYRTHGQLPGDLRRDRGPGVWENYVYCARDAYAARKEGGGRDYLRDDGRQLGLVWRRSQCGAEIPV